MANAYNLRLNPIDSGDAMFTLVQFLVSKGWTVTKSSDGITYNPNGNQISHSGTGAGGIKNAKAFWILRQPNIASGHWATPTTPSGAVREILIQRDTANGDTTWRIRYSHRAPFGDGFITPVAGNLLVDATDKFTINDGATTKTFEFDSNGSVTPGNVAVPFTSSLTAAQVSANIATAVNGSGLNVTAYVSVSGVQNGVTLVKTPTPGTITLTESVGNAGFTVATPSATITPNATGSQDVLGGGTDAVPTMATLFPAAGTYRWNMIVHDAVPYGFVAFGWLNGGSNVGPALMFDPMLDGTFTDADLNPSSFETDPYVCYADYTSGSTWKQSFGLQGRSGFGNTPKAWAGTGLSSQAWGAVAAADYAFALGNGATPNLSYAFTSSTTTTEGPSGMNPFNSKDIALPVPYIFDSGILKGYSTFMRYLMSAARSPGLLGTETTSRDKVVVGVVALDWDGGGALS